MDNFNCINAVKNLIVLQKIFGYATAKADSIYHKLCDEKALDAANIGERLLNYELTDKLRKRIEAFDFSYADRVLDICAKNSIKITAICDLNYPERLRNTDTPPLVLFIKGNLPDIDEIPVICIVGPRKVSDFGGKAAYSLSLRLARAGFLIVSGAALGADSFAHKGALNANGSTLAVLGHGLLYDYLPENRALRERIAKNCCLITEFHPNEPSSRHTFPIRNRIMSALALGTIVVEGDTRSGAVITGKHACEQGRDVFVIPGNPTLECYKGSNELLRDGAKPLLTVSDVFDEYVLQFPDKIDTKKAFQTAQNSKVPKKITKNLNVMLSNEGKIVYNYLDKQIFTADDLSATGLSYEDILSALTELEINGLIESLPGGNYKLK